MHTSYQVSKLPIGEVCTMIRNNLDELEREAKKTELSSTALMQITSYFSDVTLTEVHFHVVDILTEAQSYNPELRGVYYGKYKESIERRAGVRHGDLTKRKVK